MSAKNTAGTVMGRSNAVFFEEEEMELVSDVYEALELEGSYTATVGGEPASMDTKLSDGDFVVFAKATKGGC